MAALAAARTGRAARTIPRRTSLYVYSQSGVAPLGLVPPPAGCPTCVIIQGTRCRTRAHGRLGRPPVAATARRRRRRLRSGGLDVQGLPLIKPPYGRISAIDLNKGEIVWQVAHGETPDNIRNHPALKGLNIPRTGRPGVDRHAGDEDAASSPARPASFTTPSGQRGAMLRAYDKATGKEVGAVYMPAPQTGSPMTYMLNGKQYIVLAIGGPGFPAELLALKVAN